jgi:hypothetical protein
MIIRVTLLGGSLIVGHEPSGDDTLDDGEEGD